MKIKFLNHASVVVSTNDAVILTDPWFFGKAFNDSWALIPEPLIDHKFLNEIDFIFISHEHPDHFHIPTLKSLPLEIKSKITILFQKNNSDKMVDAFKMLGFEKIILIKNRKKHKITNNTAVEIDQIGSMDSALIISNQNEVIVNMNDCEPTKLDCEYIKKKYKKINLVLNQFSMAGYEGFPDYGYYLKRNAERKLIQLVNNHRDLNAEITLPFASNVYFSCEDNKYVNDFSNKPWEACDFLEENNCTCLVLFPGDTYTIGNKIENSEAIKKYRHLYTNFEYNYSLNNQVDIEVLKSAWINFVTELHKKYPKWILKKLGNISLKIKDLEIIIVLNVYKKIFEVKSNQNDIQDLELNSQPLFFALKFPYGIQTLGVSARVVVNRFTNWRWYRLLASLNNAEIFLSAKYFFKPRNIQYLLSRMFKSGFGQLLYKLRLRGFINS